ncbi:hypothetical protein BDR22DRAFT_869155 [Usnea florida]
MDSILAPSALAIASLAISARDLVQAYATLERPPKPSTPEMKCSSSCNTGFACTLYADSCTVWCRGDKTSSSSSRSSPCSIRSRRWRRRNHQ